MTGTALALNSLSNEQLMAMTGQGQAPKPRLPRITVNKDAVDDHDNEVPAGTFKISQGEADALYAKTATFRPFINTYQYSLYSAKDKKVINRSIQIKNWGDEAIDELGGVRCGKVPNKQVKKLSPEAQEKNKLVKCYRHLYGTVTMSGVTQSGAKSEVTNLPVRMKLSGSNFMPFGDALNLINSLKRPMFAFNTALTLTRQKNGATIWYIINVEPDLKTIIPLTDEDANLWKTFEDMIARETDYIKEKYRDALKGKAAVSFDTKNVIDQLSAELNDEIPDFSAE